jgi:hypothetical protein
MKVGAILKTLDEFREWHTDNGQTAEAGALQELVAFLKEHERKNLTDLTAAIRASRQEPTSAGST